MDIFQKNIPKDAQWNARKSPPNETALALLTNEQHTKNLRGGGDSPSPPPNRNRLKKFNHNAPSQNDIQIIPKISRNFGEIHPYLYPLNIYADAFWFF